MSVALTFSVVIPTCGRLNDLKRCLQALSGSTQTLDANCYEVIISDDAPSAASESEVRKIFPAAIYIDGPGRGPASNRNSGARKATGEFLVFTDDDCIPLPGWLSAFQQSKQQDLTAKVLEGRVFADRPQRSFDETSPLNEKGGYLWSCNFAIEREFFNRIGGFDERFPFPAMEDIELRKRIRDAGEKIVFVYEAGVCHPWRKKKGWHEFKNHQYSTLLYLALHPSEKRVINSLSYIYSVAYGMTKFVLPRVLRGQTQGLSIQLLEYYSFLQMAFKLAFLSTAKQKLTVPVKGKK